eukprot:TRINITY_DN1838_c0_g1_i1.p2 TRINITY_DN1838_c0_g1~~TRINITY_DN1838_c0_g1_i1.p2  ORF type:complete len:66 (-),score=7.53 TRINITY_DN1838_c0_g1_i1:245-442(-)
MLPFEVFDPIIVCLSPTFGYCFLIFVLDAHRHSILENESSPLVALIVELRLSNRIVPNPVSEQII